MLSNTTNPAGLRNDNLTISASHSTGQVAALLHVRPQSLRAALCRDGHYFGVVPIKLPNRLLAWPADQVNALVRGDVTR